MMTISIRILEFMVIISVRILEFSGPEFDIGPSTSIDMSSPLTGPVRSNGPKDY